MTNGEMIQGMFNLPISDEIIKSVLYLRGFQSDESFYLEEKDVELCVADILMVLSRASQGYNQQTGSDAFTMTIRGEYIPLKDRQAMRAEANAIYKRHKESVRIQETNAINVY
ncbi:MAG: hypothetical protein II304_05590 [Bacteroidales bacterium]|nr:hypothetical protein [Bacteroidales bacterium]